jgi:hypothetical protein
MHRPLPLSLPLALTCLLVACERAPDVPTAPSQAHGNHAALNSNAPISGQVQRQIARLRELTAPFHDFQTAVAAGWGMPIPGCFSDSKLGGMGYHFGNPALIDGAVDALEPELLVYEPQKNGKLRLVAVEYLVPVEAWTASEPPHLYGQSFHRYEEFWVLHVWHFRHNPSGVFADFSPTVSCQFATP